MSVHEDPEPEPGVESFQPEPIDVYKSRRMIACMSTQERVKYHKFEHQFQDDIIGHFQYLANPMASNMCSGMQAINQHWESRYEKTKNCSNRLPTSGCMLWRPTPGCMLWRPTPGCMLCNLDFISMHHWNQWHGFTQKSVVQPQIQLVLHRKVVVYICLK